jgi:hypothetical protein
MLMMLTVGLTGSLAQLVKRGLLSGVVLLGCLAGGAVYAQDDVAGGHATPQAVGQDGNVYLPLVGRLFTSLQFDQAIVQFCEPNAGITHASGKVRQQGRPVNGKIVVFSYEPDGPIVAQTLSGPHPGYPNWSPGFFSHILHTEGRIEGDWYFWITDEAGNRISAIAYLHTDGEAGLDKCQQAYITFDNYRGRSQLNFPMAGIQAHLLHEREANVAMTAIRSLRLFWAKQQVEWSVFEPARGEFRFYMLDQMVEKGDQEGVNLLFSVVHAPGWAREEGYDPAVAGPPADPQTLANFLSILANRYCGRSVRAIEVWNEQNLHAEWGNLPLSAEDYLRLLAPSALAIKSTCPTMRVISGGLTPAASFPELAVDDFTYLEAMVDAGLLEHVDAVGVHASGYNVLPTATWEEACAAIQVHGNTFNGPCHSPHHSWSFRSTLEGYHAILEARGSGATPLWVTEFGWAAGGAFEAGYEYANDNDYDEQAEWTLTAFQMMRDWPWVEAAFLWNLDFRVVANRTQKAQWGIVDANWDPLPAFAALAGAQGEDVEQSRALIRAAVAAEDKLTAGQAPAAPPLAMPEPHTILLFGSGLLGLGAYRRRKRKPAG